MMKVQKDIARRRKLTAENLVAAIFLVTILIRESVRSTQLKARVAASIDIDVVVINS